MMPGVMKTASLTELHILLLLQHGVTSGQIYTQDLPSQYRLALGIEYRIRLHVFFDPFCKQSLSRI